MPRRAAFGRAFHLAAGVAALMAGCAWVTPVRAAPVRFAVIGDYGLAGPQEADVAALVHGWNPDFIATTGDNNYPLGETATIDANIGQYYHDYIGNYQGGYGAGSPANRFFPVPGNHDWYSTPGLQPYLDYFTLPGNERYYDVVQGPVHLFMLDSDPNEPDGTTVDSVQAQWLHAALAASTSRWNFVFLHHPPYGTGGNSGIGGVDGDPDVRWPYLEWGASAIFAGHDHQYERLLLAGGLPEFIVGCSGSPYLYPFNAPMPESQFRFTGEWGALLVEADDTQASVWFYLRDGTLLDGFAMSPPASAGANGDYPEQIPPVPEPASLALLLALALGLGGRRAGRAGRGGRAPSITATPVGRRGCLHAKPVPVACSPRC